MKYASDIRATCSMYAAILLYQIDKTRPDLFTAATELWSDLVNDYEEGIYDKAELRSNLG